MRPMTLPEPCAGWINIGREDEQQCGKPATDVCDMCGRPRCDDHMEIKRNSGRNFGRTMCSTLRHS